MSSGEALAPPPDTDGGNDMPTGRQQEQPNDMETTETPASLPDGRFAAFAQQASEIGGQIELAAASDCYDVFSHAADNLLLSLTRRASEERRNSIEISDEDNHNGNDIINKILQYIILIEYYTDSIKQTQIFVCIVKL